MITSVNHKTIHFEFSHKDAQDQSITRAISLENCRYCYRNIGLQHIIRTFDWNKDIASEELNLFTAKYSDEQLGSSVTELNKLQLIAAEYQQF